MRRPQPNAQFQRWVASLSARPSEKQASGYSASKNAATPYQPQSLGQVESGILLVHFAVANERSTAIWRLLGHEYVEPMLHLAHLFRTLHMSHIAGSQLAALIITLNAIAGACGMSIN